MNADCKADAIPGLSDGSGNANTLQVLAQALHGLAPKGSLKTKAELNLCYTNR